MAISINLAAIPVCVTAIPCREKRISMCGASTGSWVAGITV